MFKTRRLVLLLGISILIMTGCKDISKNESDTDTNTSSKIEKKNDTYAIIHLDDGREIEMKDKRPSGNSNAPSRLTANISENGMIIMLKLDTYKTPLEDRVYEDPLEGQIVLTSISHDGPLGKEAYRSYNTNEDGKEGKMKITLISHDKNHSEGTFKGTLYSPSHKQAVVEGKFITNKRKK